jgi:release factor glutamine methyltransferase
MKYFYKNMELDVPQSVYYPREDSELLADVLMQLNLKGKKCLEMGCGCGLLAIIMARKGAIVTAADKNMEAVSVSRENALHAGQEINIHSSDLFSEISGKFYLIVFNPPYLPGDDHEKIEITYYGGPDGRQTIKKFLEEAKNFLKKNGRILLLISTITGEKEVWDLAMDMGYSIREIARKKVPFEELIVLELGV